MSRYTDRLKTQNSERLNAHKRDNIVPWYSPLTIAVTCFWVGKFPIASGTMGSVFGVFLLGVFGLSPRVLGFDSGLLPYALLAFTALITWLGVVWSERYVQRTGKKDPKEVVIDEVAGVFVTASGIALGFAILLQIDYRFYCKLLTLTVPFYLVAGFVLFRIFDIFKPWIVRRIDSNVKGGLGVMMDDVAAGVLAALAFHVLLFGALESGLLNHVVYNKGIVCDAPSE